MAGSADLKGCNCLGLKGDSQMEDPSLSPQTPIF